MRILLVCGLLAVSAPLAAQQPRQVYLPTKAFNYARQPLPKHFDTATVRRADNEPRRNRVTDDGATLGRVLFYDKQMSKNGKIACASCHLQKHGFSDGKKTSEGFLGGKTMRNSMGLANARYHPNGRFFWDERARTLEDQVLMPIQDKVEMGMTLDEVVARVSNDPIYKPLFQYAFGTSSVSSRRISQALAQFVRSIISYRTKFDAGLAKAGSISASFANFSALENQGKRVFLARGRGGLACASCHMNAGRRGGRGASSGPLFITARMTNNGVDADDTVLDTGLGDRTYRVTDHGRFKVPSLRNIELTRPYMHDGRFATLREVMDHYDRGIKRHPNLDFRLRGRGGRGGRGRRGRSGNLSSRDKDALVAFLKTLTDHELVRDPKFSDPFKKPR